MADLLKIIISNQPVLMKLMTRVSGLDSSGHTASKTVTKYHNTVYSVRKYKCHDFAKKLLLYSLFTRDNNSVAVV